MQCKFLAHQLNIDTVTYKHKLNISSTRHYFFFFGDCGNIDTEYCFSGFRVCCCVISLIYLEDWKCEPNRHDHFESNQWLDPTQK